MPQMLAPEALRHQHFNFVAQQLFTSVAEEFLYLGIDQHNLSLPVNYHDGIGCGFQERPKFLLSALMLGDVSKNSSKGEFIAYFRGRQRKTDWKLSSIFAPAY